MPRLTINDIELIPALHQGQPAAFQAVFSHFVDPVRHFIEQIVDDRYAAEDIAVDVFTRAFHKHTDFSTVEKLKGFLFIAAGNAAKDFLRVQKRNMKALQEMIHQGEHEEESIEVAYIRAEAARAVRDAVNAVPGQAGEVLRMVFLDGKTLSEISAELGIAYNTVQNHRTRGLQLVRQRLTANQVISSAGLMFALTLLECR